MAPLLGLLLVVEGYPFLLFNVPKQIFLLMPS